MKTDTDERMHRNAGWAVTTLWLCIVIAWSVHPTGGEAEALQEKNQDQVLPSQNDFKAMPASAEAHGLVDWILSSNDHQGLPFAVVDKINARVFVFNRVGQFLGNAPVLLGLERGDDGLVGIGERALSRIRPEERITPSGRFMANLARNLSGQDILWVSYEQSISMHALRSADPKERRPERLASPTEVDNRISYGCINVPRAFWRDIVFPTFKNQQSVVYVLPETRSFHHEFGIPITRPLDAVVTHKKVL